MSIRTLIALALATCGTFVLACSDDPDGRVDGGGASGTGGVGSGGVGGGTGGSGGTGGVGGAAPRRDVRLGSPRGAPLPPHRTSRPDTGPG